MERIYEIYSSTLGQEFDNEMNSNEMDSEMNEMDSLGDNGSQNNGMKKSIMQNAKLRKQLSDGRNTYPTAPVRDLIGERFGVEKEDDRQMIQTRNKIQKGEITTQHH